MRMGGGVCRCEDGEEGFADVRMGRRGLMGGWGGPWAFPSTLTHDLDTPDNKLYYFIFYFQ